MDDNVQPTWAGTSSSHGPHRYVFPPSPRCACGTVPVTVNRHGGGPGRGTIAVFCTQVSLLQRTHARAYCHNICVNSCHVKGKGTCFINRWGGGGLPPSLSNNLEGALAARTHGTAFLAPALPRPRLFAIPCHIRTWGQQTSDFPRQSSDSQPIAKSGLLHLGTVSTCTPSSQTGP